MKKIDKIISKGELAQEYNIHVFTLRRWLKILLDKKIIEYKKRYILAKELAIIKWHLEGIMPPAELGIDCVLIENQLKTN